MDSIRAVFSANLKALRGEKTQAAIAELAGIPFSTYQTAEYGKIPQEAAQNAIARALGVPVTRLFLDPDLIPPPQPTLTDQTAEIAREAAEKAAQEAIKRIEAKMASAAENAHAAPAAGLQEVDPYAQVLERVRQLPPSKLGLLDATLNVWLKQSGEQKKRDVR